MAQTASDVLIDTIRDWGVDTVFGLPGDGIDPVIEALRQRQDRIKFILVRHEEAAAFAACGYAKFTGKLGVCLATSGPGGIHLLNGLYDAKLDQQQVLAITGMHFSDLLDTFAQQDVDLPKVFEGRRRAQHQHVGDVLSARGSRPRGVCNPIAAASDK